MLNTSGAIRLNENVFFSPANAKTRRGMYVNVADSQGDTSPYFLTNNGVKNLVKGMFNLMTGDDWGPVTIRDAVALWRDHQMVAITTQHGFTSRISIDHLRRVLVLILDQHVTY